jgi:hypothetical protein
MVADPESKGYLDTGDVRYSIYTIPLFEFSVAESPRAKSVNRRGVQLGARVSSLTYEASAWRNRGR